MKKTTKKLIRLMAASLIGLMLLSYGLLAMTLDTESNPIINYICIGGGFIFCMVIVIFVVKEGLNNQSIPK
ncbi:MULTISPECIES: hypothetical protein [Pseudoalteromonas]|uniref:hypothetical protein n=1 Tax=Pseudoalteromonas TaxID=53246 RepID=UPI00026D1C1A|nr:MULTISPECIES: hypothetical protein [Pseudoalteromonas]MBA6411262.1 hypothetical protein [Pseudoalteromonas sp. 5Ae-yellow]MBB1305923.1 hypothetical protein [Pseudoalteromonas sp. SR43-5]MBB1401859.1 hypothetical protein [Pseudoalteromonas sp. SG45-1]MBH0001997.1 hypothetical protein [Pseudoalteromonas sp. SWYJZ12]